MLKEKIMERAKEIYEKSPDKPLFSVAMMEALIEKLPASVLKGQLK
jgi:hypothetical protein